MNYNVTNYIWIFLFSFLNNYPLMPLRYYIFKDKLKISFTKIMIITFFLAIIQGLSFIYMMQTPNANGIYISIHNFFFAIFFLIIGYFFINDSLLKIIYVPALFIPIVFLIYSFPLTIDDILHIEALTITSYKISVLSRIILMIILYPFLYMFSKKYIIPIINMEICDSWNRIFIIPCVFCFLDSLITRYIFTSKYTTIYFIIRLTIMIACLLTTIVLSDVINATIKKTELEENEKYMKTLLNMQTEQYLRLSENIEKTRIARHDLRHHLTYIKSLLDDHSYENVKNYLDEYVSSLPLDKPLQLTENIALNSICSHYISLANSKNINISYDFFIPQNISIADNDLCVIAGNSIENAIEACSYLDEANRFIKIRMKLIGSNLSIIVSNSFDGNLNLDENNKYISRKREHNQYGIGISSICTIIKKYNGIYNIDTDNNIFNFKMLIPCEEW